MSSPLNILIVDEEFIEMEFLRDLLKRDPDLKVRQVTTCSEALALLNETDIAIIDLMLPIGNISTSQNFFTHPLSYFGMDLCLNFKKEKPSIKIIGCSVANSTYIQSFFEGINSPFLCKLHSDFTTKIQAEILKQKRILL